MNKACKLCGSSSFKRLFNCEAGNVLKCKGCGLVSLDVIPAGHDELKNTYSKDYFLEREDYFFKDGVIDASGDEKPHVKDFRNGLSWIGQYRDPPGKLLDIGCAAGTFLSIAKEKGWECYGVEISDYAASITKKTFSKNVFRGSIREAHLPDNYFDVVTMWDTIEHLQDPCEELQEIYRVLKTNGLLLVNTPNEESFMKKMARCLYKVSGGNLKFPVNRLYHVYHLYYFSISTMRLLFKKTGFQLISTRKKVIPITRARGSTLIKTIVRGLSVIERLFHGEYELFFIAQKSD